ncbi:thioesterase family protein [Castellaniella sp.]|uniref:thioesterase family protein n=1 Tax=Castellaniella sp. TaxID=1955812 RepID=UPI00356A791C
MSLATTILQTEVAAEWLDDNGHMYDTEYGRLFCIASNCLMDGIGLDTQGRQTYDCTLYTLETHVRYLGKVRQGEVLKVTNRILDRDAKRIHAFFSIYRADGQLIATGERLFIAMSTTTRRPTTLPEAVQKRLDTYGQLAHSAWPAAAGRPMGIRKGDEIASSG